MKKEYVFGVALALCGSVAWLSGQGNSVGPLNGSQGVGSVVPFNPNGSVTTNDLGNYILIQSGFGNNNTFRNPTFTNSSSGKITFKQGTSSVESYIQGSTWVFDFPIMFDTSADGKLLFTNNAHIGELTYAPNVISLAYEGRWNANWNVDGAYLSGVDESTGGTISAPAFGHQLFYDIEAGSQGYAITPDAVFGDTRISLEGTSSNATIITSANENISVRVGANNSPKLTVDVEGPGSSTRTYALETTNLNVAIESGAYNSEAHVYQLNGKNSTLDVQGENNLVKIYDVGGQFDMSVEARNNYANVYYTGTNNFLSIGDSGNYINLVLFSTNNNVTNNGAANIVALQTDQSTPNEGDVNLIIGGGAQVLGLIPSHTHKVIGDNQLYHFGRLYQTNGYLVPISQSGITNGLVGAVSVTVNLAKSMPTTNYFIGLTGKGAIVVSPQITTQTTSSFTFSLTAFTGAIRWFVSEDTQ